MIFKQIKEEIAAIKERDPAAPSAVEVFLLYSGLHAIIWYRCSHYFYKHNLFFIARFISQTARFFTGIEIHPGATIGKGLFIDHGSGIVVGETTVIGDNCTLYQGVTLGGTGKDKGKRHPTLLDNVMVGSGAKVLGPVVIGNNVKIAANAVVLTEIPDDSTAVGVPARVVAKKGKTMGQDMDQIHMPDPVSQQLCKLNLQIEQLSKEIEKLKKEKGEIRDEII